MNNETLLLQKNQHWKEELVKHSSCANPSVAFAVSRKWLCIGVMETFNSNGPNVSCSVFFSLLSFLSDRTSVILRRTPCSRSEI